jgi:Mn-dependent DtxR family transcriptional regulator
MMAVMAGLLFLGVFFFAPRYGLASRLLSQFLLALKIVRDDILGFLYRLQELAPAESRAARISDVQEALKGRLSVAAAVKDLKRRNMVRQRGDRLLLTEMGLEAGRNLVRAHRLWESYLCDTMGYCEADVHRSAHRLEHFTDSGLQAQLGEDAGNPEKDPHLREIP